MSLGRKVGIFQRNKWKKCNSSKQIVMFKGIWMKQSSPYKDPCSGIKIHSKDAIDNAEKIARDQITNIFVCSAKVYDFYLIAEGGGV